MPSRAKGTPTGGTPALALLEDAQPEARAGDHVPHVIAWNLTRRCNLECAHCYIAAGPSETARDELTLDECIRIADEMLAVNPAPLFILSGGEPLLRDDLEAFALHATRGGATVVVGTNGTLLTDARIVRLKDAGVRGVAVSVESLRASYHDRFRRGHGSLAATLEAVERLARHELDVVPRELTQQGDAVGRIRDAERRHAARPRAPSRSASASVARAGGAGSAAGPGAGAADSTAGCGAGAAAPPGAGASAAG